MKTFINIITFLILSQLYAQNSISASDWQHDLLELQQIVHKDYPFLFKKVSAEEFDKHVTKLYDEIPNLQDHEILVGFAKIVALFKYGHTRLGFRESPVSYHQLPIYVYQYDDGVYIHSAHKDYASIVGSKLIAIEGVLMPGVLEAIHPVVPVENEQFFKAYSGLYLVVPEILHAVGITPYLQQEISLILKKDDVTFMTTVKAVQANQTPLNYGEVIPNSDWVGARADTLSPLYLKNLDKIYYDHYLPEEKTVYIRHSQIQDDPEEDIPSFYNRVFDFIENNDVEKLVLDVRLNGGGNNYKNKPIITGIIETKKINQVGKLFVIIGRRTFSACQNLVNELDNYTNAIFVGEPTGENINFYGDNRRIELSKTKLTVYLSFAWWQDKPQWENKPWLAPHLAVTPTFEQYRTNQDPVLEAALNFDTDNFIIDPMAYLRGLFMENKLDFLQQEAKRLVDDPKYGFFDFEEEFDKAGQSLVNGEQLEGALYVFELNSRLFPYSAQCWASLAQLNATLGNTGKAKELYQKAIVLDPDGAIGQMAKKQLQEISTQN